MSNANLTFQIKTFSLFMSLRSHLMFTNGIQVSPAVHLAATPEVTVVLQCKILKDHEKQ